MAGESSVICVFSNKGGSGKTTIAVHLALAGRSSRPLPSSTPTPRGQPPMVEAPAGGPQESRHGSLPGREAAERALRLAREERYRFVVIDLPPHATAQIVWLLQEADLILVPTRRPPPTS